MTTDKKIRVAIVGLGFGAEFIPIYQRHPNAEMYAICRRDRRRAGRVRRPVRRSRSATPSYEELLADPNVDAVHINSPIADHAPQSIAALKAGKHVASTVPAATTIDECRQIVEAQRAERQGLHDDGDRRLQPRVPVREGAVRQGRARPDPVPARQPSAGHGRLAGLLGRLSADALRDALRQPVPGAARQARRARRLPRLGPDRRGPDPEVRQPVRDRDRDVQAARLGRLRRGDAQPVRHRAPVPRELRRLRLEEVVRVAAGRERRAGDPHQEHRAGAAHRGGDPEARHGARLRAPAARSRSAASRSRRRSRTPTTCRSCRAAATAARTRTWSTTSCWPASARQPAMPDAETSVNWTMVGICAHQSALKDGEKIAIPAF